MTVKKMLEQVGVIPVTVLVVRNGKLLTEDVLLEPDDEVKLHAVISGG
ncbi:MAG: thiamine biosynthesis protein ThiS [Anaerolineae bacterium]|nr:thiamine biosynthesis protein ThiS [Anaerolineae bacterium]